jgi:hypothetical protein
MSSRSIAVLALLVATGLSRSGAAQVRADPGTVIDGRVAVRVNITLSDEEISYVPVGGVSLRFFRTTADTTVVLRTDAAGTATAMLLPGEYRLMSTSPVDWKGARYSWSQLVEVRAGLPTVELTAASAERTAVAAPARTDGSPSGSATAAGPVDDATRAVVAKDPAAATMYAFFLPGSGQMYSGERAKGAGLLTASVVGIAVAAKQLSCAAASDCKATGGGMALGAAGMVAFFGSWIYGIVDAADAARRFNLAHGVGIAALEAIVAPGAGGQTRFGLSVALGR